MTLAQQITRVPRAFDRDKGNEFAALVPDVDAQTRELLCGAAGCSPYLASLIDKQREWLPRALEAPDDAVDGELRRVAEFQPDELSDNLRRSKQRIALITALADLGGAWSLAQVTGTLTRFADAATHAAITATVGKQIKRKKLPGATEADIPDAAGLSVFAMGKMGAGELNYSSDIDLICLFDETRYDPEDFFTVRQAFVRATREMCSLISDKTAQGYVFRTDLRLRPDPSVTPVCIAMEAAEQYYESLGRTWERAAYIKARPAAGDLTAGQAFLDRLTPFVWRRHLDFAAIQDAHDMRLAIRAHKSLGGPITLPDHNMKLGRGGIREIEFFTQTRQLIAGGRDLDLRCRGTVEALNVLSRKGWVSPGDATELQEHYVVHRTIEHRLQMVQDARTHTLPVSDEGFERLAAMMDRDVPSLTSEIAERLAAVHSMTEGFFAPSDVIDPDPEPPVFDDAILSRWVSYPALRSTRSREVFSRLRPELLARLENVPRPQDALLAFDGFLSGLPAGVQLFSLLEANPSLTDLLIDIVGTSPALGQYLARNAAVFDAVIGGDFFTEWPGQVGLQDVLSRAVSREMDYESKLDQTRRWFKEWHFRVGVHLLRGLIKPREARQQYTDLARAVLRILWPVVCKEFAVKHGEAPGRGAVVLGMGSLGAGMVHAGSDLDLIVIYDPEKEEISHGKKQLHSRTYYARLTQSFITALSAPMAQGKLFEVDMRLRPSGNQGPVATSWAAFTAYQKEEAWLWEHLALTRASVIAGSDTLARDVSDFRTALLSGERDTEEVFVEVAQMRDRIAEAKTATGVWDVRIGPGRLQEIELLAQAGNVLSGDAGQSTREGLTAAVRHGVLPEVDADILSVNASLYADVRSAFQLLTDGPIDLEALGKQGQQFVSGSVGFKDIELLEKHLSQSYDQNARIISDILARYHKKDGQHEG